MQRLRPVGTSALAKAAYWMCPAPAPTMVAITTMATMKSPKMINVSIRAGR
jgi:hypothetical protein